MTKESVMKYLAPTIAWGIRLLVVAGIILLFAWWFEIGWVDVKDLVVLIFDKITF